MRREDANRTSAVYSTQAEAETAAEAALRRSGGEVRVQDRDGRVRRSVTLGRDPMAMIAAVEGIRLSAEMKRTLRALDQVEASSDERRKAIALHFGKKS